MTEFLEDLNPDVWPQIKEAVKRTGATHLALARCEDLWSSQLGRETVMTVGPDCTYKTPEDCAGKWLGDLPSQRQYFIKYAKVDL